jgi:hypothetical protein
MPEWLPELRYLLGDARSGSEVRVTSERR